MEPCFLFQDRGSGTAWLPTPRTEPCLRTTSWSWLYPVNPSCLVLTQTFIYLSVDPRLLMPRNGSWSWSYINLSCVLISRQALILSLTIQSQPWSIADKIGKLKQALLSWPESLLPTKTDIALVPEISLQKLLLTSYWWLIESLHRPPGYEKKI
jgi:hypothetical protein